MTLQDFKDQVARETTRPGELGTYLNFDQVLELGPVWREREISDRAAELYAKEREDDGYKAGYTDAYEGRPHKFAVQKDWGDELPY